MSEMKLSNIELEQLVREGFGVSDIARKVGVSKGTVSKSLKAPLICPTSSDMIHEKTIAE
jgi:predicted transcriptional regulator